MHLPFWPNPSGYRNIELGLDRVFQLLERLDNPHLRIPPAFHIAGTNGKGSTLAYLRAIFEDADLKVHSYISPHLVKFNERIILSGKEIGDDFLNEILQQCKTAAELAPKINVTFFEGITVAAFLAFSKVKADVLLLETGMGGRFDATNVVNNPALSIITSIAFDHTEFLGKTLSKIAFEKAGIIKKNLPTIVSKQKPSALKTITNVAIKNNSPVFAFGENWLSGQVKRNISNQHSNQMFFEFDNQKIFFPLPALLGNHQVINAGTAIAAIYVQKHFKISSQNIANGLTKAVWQARLQPIKDGKFYQLLPKNFQMFLDGSHNKAGAETISNWLGIGKKKNSNIDEKNYLICAMLKEKDSPSFLKTLTKQTEFMIALSIKDEQKSKTANEMMNIAIALGIRSETAQDFDSGIKRVITYHAQNHPNQMARIIICGSLYLAGEFLKENLQHNI